MRKAAPSERLFRLTGEWVDKPGSVIRTTIYLERASPCVSSAQPGCTEGRPYRIPICVCSRWGLPSRAVADALVRSYRTFSAFLPQSGGVSFSVALSVGLPRPAVSWHLALWSPDFPRMPKHTRPSDPLEYAILADVCQTGRNSYDYLRSCCSQRFQC